MTAVAVTVLVGIVGSPIAVAGRPTPSATQLHQQVHAATLLQNHGVRPVCRQCDALVVTAKPGGATPLRTTEPAGYSPSELATAYSLPANSRSTATIAVIGAGVDGNLAADLATYRATFGLPACTEQSGCLRLLDYTGGPQVAPQQSGQGAAIEEEVAAETSLDVDMASAACPSCRLMYVSVPWQDAIDDNDVSTGDFAAAVRTAIKAGASAVSISYGYTADVTNTHGDTLAALSHKGVAITASTGDEGFNGGVHQSWPSNLPGVVAVGGTTLPAAGKETAWSLAGSGCETAFAKANGQPKAVTAACNGHRAAADVSADADPSTGVAVYDTYAPTGDEPNNWLVIGGTSASSPYIAGLYARAGHLSAVDGPNTLYAAKASAFNDVTSGNNEIFHHCADFPGSGSAVCNAGPGWDGPTGLGSPHGLAAF
ncbi:peptidase S8 [Kutzneria kofuensis]